MNWGPRQSLAALAVLSLLFSVAAMALCVRSYWDSDLINLRYFSTQTSDGIIETSYWASDLPNPPPMDFHYNQQVPRNRKARNLWGVQPALAPIGFAYDIVRGQGFRVYRAMVPLWFVAMISALPGLIWLRLYRGRWRREGRLAAGLCPNCGYDLRMTPQRCPECGAKPIQDTHM